MIISTYSSRTSDTILCYVHSNQVHANLCSFRQGSGQGFHRGASEEEEQREIVGADLVSSELLTKVDARVDAVGVVESLAILSMAALDFAIASGSIRVD